MRRLLGTRLLAPAAAIATVSLLAACGGSTAGQSSASQAPAAAGERGEAAKAIPADALAFVDVNVDPNDASWQKVQALGQKFPGWDKLVQEFRAGLSQSDGDGSSYARDIEPWLGGEVAVGVLSVDVASAQPEAIVYAASKDDAKANETIARQKDVKDAGTKDGYHRYEIAGDQPMFVAVGDGAVIGSNRERALDDALRTRAGSIDALADAAAYGESLAALPDDSMAVGYVNGPKVAQLFDLAMSAAGAQAAGAATAQLDQAREALKALRSIGMSLGANDKGYVATMHAVGDAEKLQALGTGTQTAFAPTLAAKVPGDAALFASFRDLGPQYARMIDQLAAAPEGAQITQMIGQFEQMSGLSFKDDVVPLLSGEHALYLSGSSPIGGGLLLKPEDATAGAATLQKLFAVAGKQAGVTFQPIAGGQQGTTPDGKMTVSYVQDGDVLRLGLNAASPGGGLDGADAYRSALADAGAPDETSALFWIDVQKLIAIAQQQGGDALTAEQQANADHVGPIVAWSTSDGDTMGGTLFVSVR